MNKLDNNDLEKVAGGRKSYSEIESHVGRKVGKYNVEVGKKYVAAYFQNHNNYFVGVCINTFEGNNMYGTIRTHIIRTDAGEEIELNGNTYEMYEYI